MTTLGVLFALWRLRRLLAASMGHLLASLHGYALGGALDPRQLSRMPEELQPLAGGIGDLAARMNAAYDELQQVLDQREHIIAERTESLRLAVSDLDRLSRTDALTGSLNYRGFQDAAERLWREARATGAQLSVLALDIDHFKKYNDLYGHAEGDGALRRFAGAVSSALLHADDLLARPGGEEFVVFLPGSTQEQAMGVGRARLRTRARRRHRARRIAGRTDDGEHRHRQPATGRRGCRADAASRGCRALSRQGRGPQPGQRLGVGPPPGAQRTARSAGFRPCKSAGLRGGCRHGGTGGRHGRRDRAVGPRGACGAGAAGRRPGLGIDAEAARRRAGTAGRRAPSPACRTRAGGTDAGRSGAAARTDANAATQPPRRPPMPAKPLPVQPSRQRARRRASRAAGQRGVGRSAHAAARATARRRFALDRAKPSTPGIATVALRAVQRWFTVGNVPVKIGMLVLFAGVASLLKYGARPGLVHDAAGTAPGRHRRGGTGGAGVRVAQARRATARSR